MKQSTGHRGDWSSIGKRKLGAWDNLVDNQEAPSNGHAYRPGLNNQASAGPGEPTAGTLTTPPRATRCPRCSASLGVRLASFGIGGKVLEVYCALCGRSWPLWGQESVGSHGINVEEPSQDGNWWVKPKRVTW